MYIIYIIPDLTATNERSSLSLHVHNFREFSSASLYSILLLIFNSIFFQIGSGDI